MKFDRVTFDQKIMGGRACIRGMRIPVSVIERLAAVMAESADAIARGAVISVEETRHRVRHLPIGGTGDRD